MKDVITFPWYIYFFKYFFSVFFSSFSISLAIGKNLSWEKIYKNKQAKKMPNK